MSYSIENTLKALENKGVNIIDPRQVYVSPEVDLDRIYPGSVLYPGTRITGSRTLIGSGAKIGTEGPAVVNDSVIGAKASIASPTPIAIISNNSILSPFKMYSSKS